jgi:hypothetical protein
VNLFYDGLERELKFFNQLEGAVCAMCAPGDQRKSRGKQREQADLSKLQSAPRRYFARAVISFGEPPNLRGSFAESSVRIMGG